MNLPTLRFRKTMPIRSKSSAISFAYLNHLLAALVARRCHDLDRTTLRVVERGSVTTMRSIAFLIIALMLGGCMQETLAPVTQAGWSARDRQLMSNLPYAQATIPEEFHRHIVSYTRKEVPGTIVV